MIHIYSVGMKRKLVDTIATFQQYQKDCSNLKTILHQIVLQISPFETTPIVETCRDATSVLLHHLHKLLKRSYESEDAFSGLSSSVDEFSCLHCHEMLYNPITLQCGHSFCYNCVHEKPMQRCHICGVTILQHKLYSYRNNVVLIKMLKKWHPSETTGRALVSKGLLLFSKGQYEEAVQELSKALNHIPNSHIALAHRAEAYLILGNLEKALEDTRKAINLAHKWAKPHFIKGEILFKQRCYEEALFSFLMALVLDSTKVMAQERCYIIIGEMLSKTVNRLYSGQQEKKRKPSTTQEEAASSVPLKRSFGGIREAFSQTSNSFECTDFTGGVVETHVSSWDYGPFKAGIPSISLTAETERALDRVLFTHYTFNSSFSSSRKGGLPLRPVNPNSIDVSDFECSVCMRLLYNPVSTPCGHTFCQLCIERCLDHTAKCPLCKQPIENGVTDMLQKMHVTCDYATNSIIQQYLPTYYRDRVKQHDQEIAEIREREPVFVCTLAYPSLSCPLHIFEPRYRLMLRRSMKFNNRQFGMCMEEPNETQSRVGTLLKVRDASYFSDGRSVVNTVGVRRFRTYSCKVQDGYNVAKFNYIVDDIIKDPLATGDLCVKVYEKARSWLDGLPNGLKQKIKMHFGDFPQRDTDMRGENGPNWHWWVLAVLPVAEHIKNRVLGKSSLHERLLILHRILQCFEKRQAS